MCDLNFTLEFGFGQKSMKDEMGPTMEWWDNLCDKHIEKV